MRKSFKRTMSDHNEIDGVALDRYITGNYGEDQSKGTIDCPDCDGTGCRSDQCRDNDDCPRCEGSGWFEEEFDPGDDPDRKYDEERDRKMLGIDVPDGGEESSDV